MASEKQAVQITDEAIKEIFDTFDKNGDGSICTKELGEAFERQGYDNTDSVLNKIMERLDTDGTSTLDYEEFAKLMKKADKLWWAKAEFEKCDKNGDGFQTTDEIREMIKGWQDIVTSEDIEKVLKELDINGDGKISYAEFLSQIAIDV